MMDERLKKIVDETDNIVFFGGAGVSTESNVPDFRSKDGLYNAQEKYGYRPETMLSHSFYEKHTKTFFEYYKENLIHTEAKPNDAHKALAKLEKMVCTRRPAAKMFTSCTERFTRITAQSAENSLTLTIL